MKRYKVNNCDLRNEDWDGGAVDYWVPVYRADEVDELIAELKKIAINHTYESD